MKTRASLLAGAALACSLAPSFASAQTTLSCTPSSGLLGAPSYQLKLTTKGATLALVPLNPTVRPTLIAEGPVLRYGDATIFTVNHGRSGYAHLFHRGSAVVIDVNLFGQPLLATGHALTRYACRWR